MKWFFVTGRIDGDDEDSCLIERCVSEAKAVKGFIEFMTNSYKANNDDEDPDAVYVNYVVDCGDRVPKVLSGPTI